MKRKGFTLVEVLVSLSIFVITFGGVITSYFLSIRGAEKLEEYQYFENICLDINTIYDQNGFIEVKKYLNVSEDIGEVFYNENYIQVEEQDKYTLSYIYNSAEKELTISIYNNVKSYYVIEALEYGVSPYEKNP